MAEVVTTKTSTHRELPVCIPIKIVRGDTFLSPVYRHRIPGTTPQEYYDTSTWTITPKLYARNGCGAAEVVVGGSGIQVIQRADVDPDTGVTKYGYQFKIDAADTVGLACSSSVWYEIETDDGTTVRTYYGGPAPVTGVGDA